MFVDEGFEGAPFAAVRLLAVAIGGSLGVEGVSAFAFGDREDVIGGNVEDLGAGIDESPDQPWTGDPVDLRAGAGYPLHLLACLCVERCRSLHARAAARRRLLRGGDALLFQLMASVSLAARSWTCAISSGGSWIWKRKPKSAT